MKHLILIAALSLTAAACSKGGSGSGVTCNANGTQSGKDTGTSKLTEQSEGVYVLSEGTTSSITTLTLDSGESMVLSKDGGPLASAVLDLKKMIVISEGEPAIKLQKIDENTYIFEPEQMRAIFLQGAEEVNAESPDIRHCSTSELKFTIKLNDARTEAAYDFTYTSRTESNAEVVQRVKRENNSDVDSDETDEE